MHTVIKALKRELALLREEEQLAQQNEKPEIDELAGLRSNPVNSQTKFEGLSRPDPVLSG